MKVNPLTDRNQDSECPKRMWVMTALSDDESLGPGAALPAGLQFHLARCPMCRSLADRLMTVNRSLGELAALLPSAELEADAGERVEMALRQGARLSGRVDLSDLRLEEEVPMPHSRRGYHDLAIAASLLFAAGFIGFISLQRGGESPLVGPTNAIHRPGQSAMPRVPASSDSVARPNEQRVVVGQGPSNAAESDSGANVTGLPEPVICRFHSHVEAAMSDYVGCVPAAMVLPDPAERDLGWLRWFDKSRPTASTTIESNPR